MGYSTDEDPVCVAAALDYQEFQVKRGIQFALVLSPVFGVWCLTPWDFPTFDGRTTPYSFENLPTIRGEYLPVLTGMLN